ncbi:hypothetical protein FACS1894170_09690 [Planctomycetales bacterium]|nr:hypothetical protein FACS1894170_09690 [Planctomycetales bacterium]
MKHIILLFSLFALCVAGCSNNVRVSGKVTYEDDGSPLKYGVVMFVAEKNQFRGIIKDGVYDVGDVKQGEGIPPDTYKVWLINTERSELRIYPDGSVAFDEWVSFPQVAEEFTQPNKTSLELAVSSGGRVTYDIAVKKHPDFDKQQPYQKKEGAVRESRDK